MLPSKSTLMTVGYVFVALAIAYRVDAVKKVLMGA